MWFPKFPSIIIDFWFYSIVLEYTLYDFSCLKFIETCLMALFYGRSVLENALCVLEKSIYSVVAGRVFYTCLVSFTVLFMLLFPFWPSAYVFCPSLWVGYCSFQLFVKLPVSLFSSVSFASCILKLCFYIFLMNWHFFYYKMSFTSSNNFCLKGYFVWHECCYFINFY